MSSFSDLLLVGLNNLQADGNIRGALNNFINTSGSQGAWNPLMDMVDNKEFTIVYLDLPGVDKNNINVDFFNNRLLISGERKKPYTGVSHNREVIYGKFSRRITLPISVTSRLNVDVSYSEGILKIAIDKKKEEMNIFRINMGSLEPSTVSYDEKKRG